MFLKNIDWDVRVGGDVRLRIQVSGCGLEIVGFRVQRVALRA